MGTDTLTGRPVVFESQDVRRLLSVAHLFPKSKGRTGVYVLHFNNGEGYVGQSLNVVGRWATHRRRWDDIAALEFARVPRTRLNDAERAQIRSRTASGLSLRNVSQQSAATWRNPISTSSSSAPTSSLG